MSNEDYKQRVMSALNRYYSKPECPICGVKHWNGMLHPYGGIFVRNKENQRWCNGKVTFYPRQEKEAEA